jgi:hypothetical protein
VGCPCGCIQHGGVSSASVSQVHLFSSGDDRCNMFPLGPCF